MLTNSQPHLAATIQFSPIQESARENLNLAKMLCYEAAAKGARIICLPELSFSSHVQSIQEAANACQEKTGYQSCELSEICKTFNCNIVFGYVEYSNGCLYNSAAVLGPLGLMGNVRKNNLHERDHFWASYSDSLFPCIPTPHGTLGVLISGDLKNEHRQSYLFKNPNYKFYRRGSLDTLCILEQSIDNFQFPKDEWIELAENLGCNVIVSRQQGGVLIIDKNLNIQTNGLNSIDGTDCVIGGFIF